MNEKEPDPPIAGRSDFIGDGLPADTDPGVQPDEADGESNPANPVNEHENQVAYSEATIDKNSYPYSNVAESAGFDHIIFSPDIAYLAGFTVMGQEVGLWRIDDGNYRYPICDETTDH